MKFLPALALLAGLASLFSANAQTRIAADVLMPQYIVGGVATESKLQSAYRLTLTGLTPNATYRYFSGASGSPNTTNSAIAGDYFGIDTFATGAGYIKGYSTGKSLNGTLLGGDQTVTTNHYSEFLATAAGTYTGWFSIVATSQLTFNPGNSVHFYEQINDGAGGAVIDTAYRSTSKALSLALNEATFISGRSGLSGETFVVLYDNVAGEGRPLWVTWTESDGINTNFTRAYETEVENAPAASGAWGAYIPNALANGVRRVEYRDFDNNLVAFVSDSDGVWGERAPQASVP